MEFQRFYGSMLHIPHRVLQHWPSIPYALGQKFDKENIGLYRDDGLAIMKNKSARLADKARKELHKCFEQFGLKITAEANLHVVNFLDVTSTLTMENLNLIESLMRIHST